MAVDIATALPAGSDVTPWIIAGDLSTTAGMTCTQMLALAQPGDGGAAPVLAAALGVIPQTVLASDKSLLLVATGCMGGAGHVDPEQTNGCGSSYTPATPTTGAVLVGMSRLVSPGHVSLQAVNGSVTLPASDVRVQPSKMGTMEVDLAPALARGRHRAVPALRRARRRRLRGAQRRAGPDLRRRQLLPDVRGPALRRAGREQRGRGRLRRRREPGADRPGRRAPAFQAGPFWHKLTYALVKADPG